MSIPTRIGAPTRFGTGKVLSYEANNLPDESTPPWELTEADPDTLVEINDGILHLYNNGNPGSRKYLLINSKACDDKYIAYEMKVKLEGFNNTNPTGIFRIWVNPKNSPSPRGYFAIYKTKMRVYMPTSDAIWVDIPDTTTQYRIYRWVFDIENHTYDFFVDGTKYIDARDYGADTYSSTFQFEILGYAWDTYPFTHPVWHIYIDYLRIYKMGAKQVAVPTHIATPTR